MFCLDTVQRGFSTEPDQLASASGLFFDLQSTFT